MKYVLVFGTRPEIIKIAPVIDELKKRRAIFVLVHTGQHYNYEMDEIFVKELSFPSIHYNIAIGSRSAAAQTGAMLVKIERILLEERPDIVLVQGDTNSTLAGALAANKLGIKVGHIEAGLRSFDRNMPEEINRALTDHAADFLFAPTPVSATNLLLERIRPNRIFITGNTIVDSVLKHKVRAKKISTIVNNQRLIPKKYFLLTLHRVENAEDKGKISELIKALKKLSSIYPMPIICPVHPRTEKNLQKFSLLAKINAFPRLRLIKAVSFYDFLELEANARLILTDSGGVQEEACLLKVPCLTLRNNTERPETVKIGVNKLVGVSDDTILKGAKELLNKKLLWKNVFGNGKSAEKIVDICEGKIDPKCKLQPLNTERERADTITIVE